MDREGIVRMSLRELRRLKVVHEVLDIRGKAILPQHTKANLPIEPCLLLVAQIIRPCQGVT